MEEEIFKGQTLIINLDSIEMVKEDYVYQEGDKVRIALKEDDSSETNALYKEITPESGQSKAEAVFTASETMEKLKVGIKYIVQADLINAKGTFPMFLQYLKVIGTAIIPDDKE